MVGCDPAWLYHGNIVHFNLAIFKEMHSLEDGHMSG